MRSYSTESKKMAEEIQGPTPGVCWHQGGGVSLMESADLAIFVNFCSTGLLLEIVRTRRKRRRDLT